MKERKKEKIENLIKFTEYFRLFIKNFIINTESKNPKVLKTRNCRLNCRKNLISKVLEYHGNLKKNQVNITFTSTLWLKKDHIFHHRKAPNKNFSVAQNKNFSVISKYHLSFNFLPQHDRIFHHGKSQNKNFSVTSKYHLAINFLPQKRPHFPSPKSSNKNISVISKYHHFINFLSQKRPYFPFPKSSKQEPFSNQ